MLKENLNEHSNTIDVTMVISNDSKTKRTKTMDRNKMKSNAEKVFAKMKMGYRYTLNRLQEITAIGTTELCMAILVLIRDNKVKQFQCEEGVCYALCKN